MHDQVRTSGRYITKGTEVASHERHIVLRPDASSLQSASSHLQFGLGWGLGGTAIVNLVIDTFLLRDSHNGSSLGHDNTTAV